MLPSQHALEDQVLDVQPLVLDVLDGTRRPLRGRADFRDPTTRRFRFAVNARGLRWGGAATTASTPAQAASDTPVIRADADLGLAGTLEAWAAIGTRDACTRRRAARRSRSTAAATGAGVALALAARDDAQRPAGCHRRRALGAALGWDLDATLAGFDPGYFAPDWRRRHQRPLASQGTHARRRRAGASTSTRRELAGACAAARWRPRARGAWRCHGDAGATAYEGDSRCRWAAAASMRSGKHRRHARRRRDASRRCSSTTCCPMRAGTLRGTLQAAPARAPRRTSTADLAGSGLRWGDYAPTR